MGRARAYKQGIDRSRALAAAALLLQWDLAILAMLRFVFLMSGMPVLYAASVVPRAKNFLMIVSLFCENLSAPRWFWLF